MKDCMARLKSHKADIMLEFRQTYNGPRMRSFGNIFRAVDCPFDDAENHVRVTDLRLIAGESAVHSDMLMWDREDTAGGGGPADDTDSVQRAAALHEAGGASAGA